MFQGEKEMDIEIEKSKIYMRPYLFILLSHFFIEGLPKYKLTDWDLPNAIQVNEEDGPWMQVELNLKKCMICLDDERWAISCISTVTFVFDKLCITKIKESLMSKEILVSG